MKPTVITLEPEIATAYLNAKPDERKKAEHLVNLWLKNIFLRRKNPKQKLLSTMNQIGKIAKANGFTAEILHDILNEK